MDAFFLALRVLLSLAAVLGAIWWLKRRLGGNASQAAAALTIVTRRTLGQKASVAVVDFNGRRLLLGVTDAAVNVLSEAAVPEPAADFGQALEKASEGSPGLPATTGDPLAGSVFAKATWKQFASAVSNGGPR